MLVTRFEGVGWGVDAGPQPGTSQITLVEQEAQHVWQIPWNAESTVKLVIALAATMTPEQKREALSAFSGGIVLPNGNDAARLGMNPDGPPR